MQALVCVFVFAEHDFVFAENDFRFCRTRCSFLSLPNTDFLLDASACVCICRADLIGCASARLWTCLFKKQIRQALVCALAFAKNDLLLYASTNFCNLQALVRVFAM